MVVAGCVGPSATVCVATLVVTEIQRVAVMLALSTRRAGKAARYANSVDPDEPARNEPSHQDLHYLQLFVKNFEENTPFDK